MPARYAKQLQKKTNMRNLDFPHSLFLDRAKLSGRTGDDSLELGADKAEDLRQESVDILTNQIMNQTVDAEIITPNET